MPRFGGKSMRMVVPFGSGGGGGRGGNGFSGSDADGTLMMAWQVGHSTNKPTMLGGASSHWPHAVHWKETSFGMVAV
ncbi:MAG TPA: hypothetical protein PKC67_04095 [Kiritimatiellia bacterium]|nr:hypothetical protein [Kiritimatiellia bacterium]HMP33510.1 hypothetical protein [Kiritimatiellia bacterium]